MEILGFNGYSDEQISEKKTPSNQVTKTFEAKNASGVSMNSVLFKVLSKQVIR